jgi:hypothetical protein
LNLGGEKHCRRYQPQANEQSICAHGHFPSCTATFARHRGTVEWDFGALYLKRYNDVKKTKRKKAGSPAPGDNKPGMSPGDAITDRIMGVVR